MPRSTFQGRSKAKVMIQPNIGLDTAARQSVIEMLNILLADETVLSLKTGQTDGQTGGTGFSELHPLYDAQSRQINDIVAELVERIYILGGSQLSDPKELVISSRLDGKLAAASGPMGILADHEAFIRFLREDAQKCSEMYDDQGTFALLVSILRSHEKMAWILRSNIALEQFDHEK